MPLIAAETHEVTQLEPAHRKTYVLDTNVLLHDPTALTAFRRAPCCYPYDCARGARPHQGPARQKRQS
jgi:hypothetical protein